MTLNITINFLMEDSSFMPLPIVTRVFYKKTYSPVYSSIYVEIQPINNKWKWKYLPKSLYKYVYFKYIHWVPRFRFIFLCLCRIFLILDQVYQPKCKVSIRLSFLNDIHKSVTHSCIDWKHEKYSVIENSDLFLYKLDMIIESINYVPL